MSKLMKIIVLVVTCLAAGYFSSLATQSSVNGWFTTLNKPSFNPPSWLFAPVWTTLYIMMGVAGGLVWGRIDREPEVKKALTFFGIQLLLNVIWSLLFFGLKNPLLAFIEIIVLLLMIYETYHQFRKIDSVAGFLFIPYILWVSFAMILNGSIWWLNR